MHPIYLIMLFAWVILFIGFYYKNYPITMLSSMFIMIVGIYIVGNGLPDLTQFLYLSFGIIHIGIGGFVFVKGTAEEMEGGF